MVEVTQGDYDIADAANREWGAAINGPHVAVLAAAMAREAAERAVVEWQPIETAPRDGTPILAILKVTNNKTNFAWHEPNVIWATDDESDWYRGWGFDDYTHWMPLPPPPTPR